MKKRILCVFFCLIMVLSTFPLGVFASDLNDNLEYENLSSSTISSDFERVFPVGFSLEEFKENKKNTKFEYIFTMETFNNNYSEVYIYIYNPSRKVVYKRNDYNTLSVAFYSDKENVLNKNNYNKYSLSLIDSYKDTINDTQYTDGLVLKFKIEGVSLENPEYQRNYKLADLEIIEKGQSLPSSTIVGKHLQFVADKHGNTNIASKDMSTLDLTAYHTFYRTKTEYVDVYEDIQSVFFAIPNEMISIYGNKLALKLDYSIEDYNPILVVNNQKIADDFNRDFMSVNGSNDNDRFKYTVLYNKMTWLPGDLLLDGWGNGFNISAIQEFRNKYSLSGFTISLLGQPYYLYSFDNIVELPFWPDVKAPKESTTEPLRLTIYDDYDLSPESTAIFGEELLEKINNKSTDPFFSNGIIKEVKGKIVKFGQTSDLTQYTLCSKWDNILNFGKGYYNNAGEVLKFDLLQEIDLNDLKKLSVQSFSDKYLFDKYDINCGGTCESCFKCISNKAEYQNHTWFVMHYDTTKYESYDSVIIDNTTGYYDACDSFVFKTQVIRGFDVIQVYMTDNLNLPLEMWTCFPVGHAPTDFVADVTTPSEKPNLDVDDELAELIELIKKVLIIVVLFLAVMVLFKLYEILSPIFKVLNRKDKS